MREVELGADAIEYDLTAEYPSAAVKRRSTCWPATCPGQSATSRVSVRAVAVSSRSATTVAMRHPTPSLVPVTLLAPGVAVVVVAEALPEARFVLAHQREGPHPLGALPQVQMGDQQACGAPMLGGERLAVVLEHDPRLV